MLEASVDAGVPRYFLLRIRFINTVEFIMSSFGVMHRHKVQAVVLSMEGLRMTSGTHMATGNGRSKHNGAPSQRG